MFNRPVEKTDKYLLWTLPISPFGTELDTLVLQDLARSSVFILYGKIYVETVDVEKTNALALIYRHMYRVSSEARPWCFCSSHSDASR
jgi:hypothetical protein